MKIYPKKSLGQSFLVNRGVLDKIINAAELDIGDLVVEIGPGTGNLTEKLSERSGQVITIEKDHRLIGALKEKFSARGGPASGRKNTEIIEGDILKLDIEKLLTTYTSRRRPSGSIGGYKVVANIPYYITSHLLRKIFEDWPMPQLIVLMVQKEVAQRIVVPRPKGRDGGPKGLATKLPHMNLLALSVQFYSEPKIVSYVSRGSFRPIPKVDSAIIRLVPRREARIMNQESRDRFFKLIKTAFAGKRKQLVGNLSKNFGIMKEDLVKIFEEIRIRPDARAENLSLEQWIKLSRIINT